VDAVYPFPLHAAWAALVGAGFWLFPQPELDAIAWGIFVTINERDAPPGAGMLVNRVPHLQRFVGSMIGLSPGTFVPYRRCLV